MKILFLVSYRSKQRSIFVHLYRIEQELVILACIIKADARDSIEPGQRLMRSIKAPGHDTTCREDPGRDGKVLFYEDSF